MWRYRLVITANAAVLNVCRIHIGFQTLMPIPTIRLSSANKSYDEFKIIDLFSKFVPVRYLVKRQQGGIIMAFFRLLNISPVWREKLPWKQPFFAAFSEVKFFYLDLVSTTWPILPSEQNKKTTHDYGLQQKTHVITHTQKTTRVIN